MIKRLLIAAVIAVASIASMPSAALATTFTPCLRLNLPVPNDPAVANIWGTLLNTNFSLLDTASGGTGSISVAGNSNVVLTANSGAADQSRSANFIFTGTLTGSIAVLFPAGGCGSFSVKNSTSGAFTLSIGANNGSGSPAGGVYVVPQGGTAELVSDGTNVRARADLTGLGAGALASSAANTVLGNWTGSSAAAAANAMPSCADAGGNHLNYVNGTGVTCGNSGANTGGVWRLYLSTFATLANINTVISFNVKSFDTGSFCDISVNVGRCTPSVAGKYSVNCSLDYDATPSAAGQVAARVSIFVNGSVDKQTAAVTPVSSPSGSAGDITASDILSLNGSTDYVECYSFSGASGGNGLIGGGPSLTGFTANYVGP